MPQVRAALAGHELLETIALQEAERLIVDDGIELFWSAFTLMILGRWSL
jgi:hypothetical protein